MKRDLLPLAGVLSSLALFAGAASRYPGGYNWRRDFVSWLFAPATTTGVANGARPLAVLAMFVFCLSVAALFKIVSSRTDRRVPGKILEIGGIGSMVYAFLVVTPMHDLLVGIALLFYVPAMSAAFYLMYAEGRLALFWSGVFALILLLASAIMYYGNVLWHLLPLAQKVSYAACVGWLLTMQLVTAKRPGDERRLA